MIKTEVDIKLSLQDGIWQFKYSSESPSDWHLCPLMSMSKCLPVGFPRKYDNGFFLFNEQSFEGLILVLDSCRREYMKMFHSD